MDYFDVFISCLDSIHYRGPIVGNVMLNFSKSVPIKKNSSTS